MKNSFLNGLHKDLKKEGEVIVVVTEIFKIGIIIAVVLESHIADFDSVDL
jgi:hypothetical protein